MWNNRSCTSYKKYTFQFSSVTQLCQTLCDPMNCSTPGLPVHHQLPEFTQTHDHWVDDASNHLILCHPLLLLPSIFPSIRVFSDVSSSYQVAKVLEFQLQHQSFQWIFRISFRVDWFDLLAVQGALKSLLQHHSSKTSVLQCSAFFISLSLFPHLFAMKWWDRMPWSLFSECWVLSQLFHSPLSSRGSLVPLHFLPYGWYHLHIWGYWYFSRQSWFHLMLHPAWYFTWCTLHISYISKGENI